MMMMTSTLTRLYEYCLSTMAISFACNHSSTEQRLSSQMANNKLSVQIQQTFPEDKVKAQHRIRPSWKCRINEEKALHVQVNDDCYHKVNF